MTREEFEIMLRVRTDPTGMNSLRQAMGGLKSGLAQLIGASGLLGSALGGLSIGAGLAGLTRATEQVVQLSEAMARAKASTNIDGTSYQVFSAVLKDANRSGDEFLGAISRIQQLIGDAAAGGREAQETFSRLGVSFTSLANQSAGNQLETIAIALAGIKNETDRASISAKILGRFYQDMRPLLDGLAQKGFGQLKAETAATRGLISEELAQAIDDTRDRTEQGAQRMGVALANLRLAWEKVKAGAAETGAAAAEALTVKPQADNSRLDRIKAGEARLEELSKMSGELARIAEQQVKDSLSVDRFMLEREARLAYESTPKAGTRRPALPDRAFDKAVSASRMRDYSKEQSALAAQAKLEDQLAVARRASLAEQIEQGNAAYMRWQKEQQLADELAKRLKVEREQAAFQDDIRSREAGIQRVQADPLLTNRQKDALSVPLILQLNEAIGERIKKLRELQELETDPAARFAMGQEISSLQFQQGQNLANLSAKPVGFSAELATQLVQLQNGFQTVAGTITGTMATGIQAFSQQLTQAILYTGELGAALSNVGMILVEEVIMSIIRMGAQWVTTHLIMKGVSIAWHALLSALGWKQVAEVNAQEAAKTPALATNAGLASAGSFGTSAILGLAALLAIMAVASSFEYGGYTGAGARSGGVDGKGGFLAVLHPNETVIDHHHRTIGDMRIDTPRSPTLADAGESRSIVNGSAGLGQQPAVNIAFHGNEHTAETWLRSSRGQGFMVDLMKRNGFRPV